MKKRLRLERLAAEFTCPECDQPTFFPHGGIESDDLRGVRRWMCKQCGFYVGPEGDAWALYDPIVDLTDTPLNVWGCWQLKKDASEWSYLPRDVLKDHAAQVRKRAGVE
jgi:rubredoxin